MTAEQFDDLAEWWLMQKDRTNEVDCLDLENCNFCLHRPLCAVCTRWDFEDDQYFAVRQEANKLRCQAIESSIS